MIGFGDHLIVDLILFSLEKRLTWVEKLYISQNSLRTFEIIFHKLKFNIS